jgi:type VI protein secretion system component VasF
VGTDIYLFGSAQPSQRTEMVESQGDLLEVRRDSETGEFLVADSSEQQIQRRYSRRGPIETVAGIVLSAVALYLLLSRYVA